MSLIKFKPGREVHHHRIKPLSYRLCGISSISFEFHLRGCIPGGTLRLGGFTSLCLTAGFIHRYAWTTSSLSRFVHQSINCCIQFRWSVCVFCKTPKIFHRYIHNIPTISSQDSFKGSCLVGAKALILTYHTAYGLLYLGRSP